MWVIVILAALFPAGQAFALTELATISENPSCNGSWSGGTPDAWTADNANANVNVGEIQARLDGGTSVIITNIALHLPISYDLDVDAPLRWTTDATLTLNAARHIRFNAGLTATGAAAGLSINPGIKDASGIFSVSIGHEITLSGASPTLTVSGASYAWIDGLTGLQNIGTDSTTLGGHYALKTDIDASATAGWNGGTGFVPLGDASTPFTGVFDGLGHSINGLVIHRPDTPDVGLFGYSVGAVRNVGLPGCAVTGNQYVGGLVGHTSFNPASGSSGSIESCSITGQVTGNTYAGGLVGRSDDCSISNSRSWAAVTGSEQLGGLAGCLGQFSSITNCASAGAVAGGESGSALGGLVGFNLGSITSSCSAGAVSGFEYLGGLAGMNGGSILNCYSTGAVAGGGQYGVSIGGLVGGNGSSTSSITNSYSTGAVTGDVTGTNIGGLVGSNAGTIVSSYWDTQTSGRATSAGGTGLTTDDMTNSSSFIGWDFYGAGSDYDHGIWYMVQSGTRPFLRSEWSTVIANAHQVQLIGMTYWEQSSSYTLAGDIDMGELTRPSGLWPKGFMPISSFTGVLDGGGHAINGLVINRPGSNAGLFGELDGTIRKLGLVGVSVSVTGYNIGSFAGVLIHGSITNCYATGSVAGDYVGGLVGLCAHATAAITNSYSACSVSGSSAGGLVGENYYGSITNSYSTGVVTGAPAGGLVGHTAYGSVANGFWDVETSGQTSSAGGTGLTTALMKQLTTFANAGWDIDDAGGTGRAWRIYSGRTYPLLRGFLAPLTASAADDAQIYTGVPYSGGNGVAISPSDYDASKVFGAGTYGGSSQGAIAPGAYAITSGAWSDQQGYDITALSGTLTISAGPGVGRVPDGITGAPLQICKSLPQLDLTWGASCGAGVTDYAVYEGDIGTWYSHGTKAACGVTGTNVTITPSSGNHYYLVVPLSASMEGSYGTDSAGKEIPKSSNPCQPVQDLSACQ